MTRDKSLLARTANFLALVGAAGAVANATEERRAPRARDLKALGIRQADFDAIHF